MKLGLSSKIFIGMALGVAVGLALQGSPVVATTWIKPLGTLFLNLIKLIIVPLVFASLITGVCGLGDIRRLGSIGGKAFGYYLLTTGFAVTLGVVAANLLDVGGGFVIPAGELAVKAKEAPSLVDTILNIVPKNPLKALVDGEMLQIIVFSLLFGAGLLAIGDKGKVVQDWFGGVAETMYKITHWIMALAPIGVFGLITPVVAANGPAVLLPLLKLIFVAALASALHLVFVYGSLVKVLGKMSPMQFFRGAFPAMAVAFSTSSSSGTLPVSMQCCEENLNVDKSITSFVLPLGATINMDGTAIYQGVCALFIAQVYGIDLALSEQLTIILTATLASIGTAGVPGAGMIMLMMVLQATGLPLEGIALVAGVDRILDMIRTCLNVTGDLSCATVIQGGEKKVQTEMPLPETAA